jgi:hypothetical protein
METGALVAVHGIPVRATAFRSTGVFRKLREPGGSKREETLVISIATQGHE